jgi:biopolymer transport protein ExbD
VNFRRGRKREEPEINLIPLIDVLLVILIFLMVTTTYNRYAQLGVQLPTATTALSQSQAEETVEVTITRDGAIQLAGKSYSGENQAELVAAFSQMLAQHPRIAVQLAADAAAAHGRVVLVLDAARQAGITRLGIYTQAGALRP